MTTKSKKSNQSQVWRAVIHAPHVAQALGEPRHRQQVQAFGLARSRAEFGRMLAAAGLAQAGWGTSNEAAATGRWLANRSGVTKNDRDVASVADDAPGMQVYVLPLNAHGDDDIHTPCPQRA